MGNSVYVISGRQFPRKALKGVRKAPRSSVRMEVQGWSSFRLMLSGALEGNLQGILFQFAGWDLGFLV